EHGHVVVVSQRVIGPERAPVLLAYREHATGEGEQDSGWRFFHGDEDLAYASDPENMALCPLSSLLGLDPSLPAINNTPPGPVGGRGGGAAPWRPSGKGGGGRGGGGGPAGPAQVGSGPALWLRPTTRRPRRRASSTSSKPPTTISLKISRSMSPST